MCLNLVLRVHESLRTGLQKVTQIVLTHYICPRVSGYVRTVPANFKFVSCEVPRVSGSVDLNWGPRIYISTEALGESHAVSGWTKLF